MKNVKVGDYVAVSGYRGTVTEIFEDEKKTIIRVHFDENCSIAKYGQYQDGWYSGFEVIERKETK